MANRCVVLNCNSDKLTVKEEKDLERSMPQRPPSSSLQQQSSTNGSVKGEPDELSNGLQMQLVPSIQTDNEDERGGKLLKSVNELENLSIAIHAFKSRFDELQNHVDFIEKAIDTRYKELEGASLPSSSNLQNSQGACDGVVPGLPLPNPQSETEKNGKLDSNKKLKGSSKSEENELLSLCQTMCSRGLRKYIVSHLSETEKLRDQVPAALKSAPKPSKLVFECIGRFFLQGSKAYTRNSPMIPARQASVLVLEYYLMSGCVGNETGIDPALKEETTSAAIAWRKRLIVEGGVSKACEIDARGLILFIACFGIPVVFRNDDIQNLVLLSNPGEISHALRQSNVLFKRVSDISEGLMKKGMVVEAIDLAYTFGFEDKLSPQTTLTSFLQKSEEAWKKSQQQSCGFSSVQKEANEKYLAALKYVVKCLEGHKIDCIKLFPGWQLKDKITNLEKDISDANKKVEEKSVPRRKVDKSNSSNKVKIPDAKRPKYTGKDPSLASPSVTALQDQRIASHIDGNSSYDASLVGHLLDGRSYSYLNNYPAASTVHIGSVSGSLPESFHGGIVASGGYMLRGATAAPAISAGIGMPAGQFSGYQGDMMVDNVGTMLNSNSHLYKWHVVGEVAVANERSVKQSFAGQLASARVNDLYGKASVEGFAGLPDHPSTGVANRSGGSDLYRFADAVFDM